MGLFGGSQKQETRSTSRQTTAGTREQERNIGGMLDAAWNYYLSGGPQFFPGQTYAGATGDELAARQQMRDLAYGGIGQAINPALAAYQNFLSPEFLNVTNAPGYQASADAISRQMGQQFAEQIMPNIRGGSIMAGGFGDAPYKEQGALAGGRSQEALGSALAGLTGQYYGQNLGAAQNALAMAPAMANLQTFGPQLLQMVGAQERADQQQAINADRERWEFEQQNPINMLGLLQQITGNVGQYGTTQTGEQNTTTKTKQSTSPFSQLLGAGLGIAGMFPGFFPGIGSAISGGFQNLFGGGGFQAPGFGSMGPANYGFGGGPAINPAQFFASGPSMNNLFGNTSGFGPQPMTPSYF